MDGHGAPAPIQRRRKLPPVQHRLTYPYGQRRLQGTQSLVYCVTSSRWRITVSARTLLEAENWTERLVTGHNSSPASRAETLSFVNATASTTRRSLIL
jgi:hypothetical protein